MKANDFFFAISDYSIDKPSNKYLAMNQNEKHLLFRALSVSAK